jgi:large subunit ribosomal protein L31
VDQQYGGVRWVARLAVVKVWHGTADAIRGHQPASTLDYMKTDIHPEYVEAHVRCTCGNEFTTRSTQPEIHVEICSNCHPFYTGKQKLVDTGGRVERFQRRAARRARGDKS